MAPSHSFAEAIKTRRSYYALSSDLEVSDSKLEEIVQFYLKHLPSTFNSQSSRAVLVLHDDHRKVWDFTKDGLIAAIGEQAYENGTKDKINGFRGAYGTVLLFEDTTVIKGLQEKMPTYADKFPQFADHAHGGLAIALWTALENEVPGLGANLQHYNPLPDAAIKKEYDLPESWELKAQLVFGKIVAPTYEKSFEPIEKRFKSFGAKN
ncbi:type II nitroreductase [Microbotryomycetes sp. JL221]|nr:type II nitroreductase [Microbotryomycetes sp. JL221]